MVTDGSVRVERVGRAALRRSFRRRSLKVLRRFHRFTVAPDFEIRIGTAACAAVGARYRFTRPGRGKRRPRVPVTGGRTWTQVRAPAGHRPLGGVSCKIIRLSADAANPLSRSRNSRADGDGHPPGYLDKAPPPLGGVSRRNLRRLAILFHPLPMRPSKVR
jgi:hypothetical protein